MVVSGQEHSEAGGDICGVLHLLGIKRGFDVIFRGARLAARGVSLAPLLRGLLRSSDNSGARVVILEA